MTEAVTLDTCAREPIHTPGSIQPHGTLFVARGADARIVQVAANVGDFFGVPAGDALGRPVADLCADADAARVTQLLARDALHEVNPVHLTSRSGLELELVAHRVGAALVVEAERRALADVGAFDPRLRRSVIRLQRARDPRELAQLAADEVREITGFDRVMIYRFDPEWNGEVVAEARRADLEPFLGLHYPASDIPVQARRLYTQNWLRLIADVDYAPVPLAPALDPSTGAPLDMSHAHLRSVSPIHIEYLRNMGVRASMSVSLIGDGDLIGLIACHHYAGPKLLPYALRETAEYLGQALSWNIHVFDRADVAERRRQVQRYESEVASSLAGSDDLLDALALPALASLTGATGAAVVLEEGVRSVGATPDDRHIGEIVAWLRAQDQDVVATDQLSAHYPPAARWDGVAAGLLAVALSPAVGEYLLWFRPAAERTVDWAGDPRKQPASESPEHPPRLSPRGSFALWRENVRGRSAPWQSWQLEAASNLRRLLVGGARRRAASLRALNTRLVETDRAKDVFIATVSHELRTPLNAINGWVRLLTSGALPAARRDEGLQVVMRNTDALARLVDDLLDVSRIVSGNIPLEVESVDVGALVESVALAMALAAEAKGLRIKRVIGTTSTVVLGDAGRIRQIVSNVVSNAIKFTPKGGSITLSVAREGSDVEVAVRDTGVGIAPADIERVFEPFWQVDGSASRRAQGLGLGLAIAKKLVELHGGRISVESEGTALGTTFRVRLPVASARASVTSSAPATAAYRPAAERLLAGVRAAVVEDEPDSRELLRHILEGAGADVIDFATGSTALDGLRAERFDVLVSDIGMPGMDGMELINQLRAGGGASAGVPAVALTAFTRALDRTAALRAGFQAHVPKPADPEELVTVVASAVKRI